MHNNTVRVLGAAIITASSRCHLVRCSVIAVRCNRTNEFNRLLFQITARWAVSSSRNVICPSPISASHPVAVFWCATLAPQCSRYYMGNCCARLLFRTFRFVNIIWHRLLPLLALWLSDDTFAFLRFSSLTQCRKLAFIGRARVGVSTITWWQ